MNFKDLKEVTFFGVAKEPQLRKRITTVIHSLKYINQLRIG